MTPSKLRRLLREGGPVGVLLVGLILLLRNVLIHRKGAVIRMTVFLLIASIIYRGVVTVKPAFGPIPHESLSQPVPRVSAAREHGQFRLDYRLPTSPEGNCVAVVGYWQERGENLPHSCALWSLDPFDGKVHRLHYGPLVSYRVAWQAGGKRLAMTGDSFSYAGPEVTLPLWIVDVVSGRKIEVVPVHKMWYISHLAWSPDGRWLAYDRSLRREQRGTHADLGTWIVSADGKQHFRLSVPQGIERFDLVGWRPGKSEVYVNESGPYANRTQWLCDLKGDARRLEVPATYPALVDTPRVGDHICVRILKKEGSFHGHHVRTFTAEGTPELDLGSIDQTGDAKWSVNGMWLAYAQRAAIAGDVTLFLLSADGTHRKNVMAGYGREYQPTRIIWSPDSKQALVTSEQAYLVNVENGTSDRFQSSFSPCSWRADKHLIGLRSDRVGILSQKGEVEKVFPPETFTGVEQSDAGDLNAPSSRE
jgi:hypothetical protein